MELNALDFTILAVLLGFLIYGFYRGFLRQALMLAGFGLAFFLAAKFHSDLAGLDFLSGVRERSDSVALVGSFLVIFFLTAALTSMIAGYIGRRVKSDEMKAGNRILGGLLGLGVGTLLVGGVCLGLKEWKYPDGAVVPETQQQVEPNWVTSSRLVPKMANACLALVALIPQSERDKITELYEEKIKGRESDPAVGGRGDLPLPGGKLPWGDILGGSLQASSGKEADGSVQPARGRMLDLGGWHKLTSKYAADDEKKKTRSAAPESK